MSITTNNYKREENDYLITPSSLVVHSSGIYKNNDTDLVNPDERDEYAVATFSIESNALDTLISQLSVNNQINQVQSTFNKKQLKEYLVKANLSDLDLYATPRYYVYNECINSLINYSDDPIENYNKCEAINRIEELQCLDLSNSILFREFEANIKIIFPNDNNKCKLLCEIAKYSDHSDTYIWKILEREPPFGKDSLKLKLIDLYIRMQPIYMHNYSLIPEFKNHLNLSTQHISDVKYLNNLYGQDKNNKPAITSKEIDQLEIKHKKLKNYYILIITTIEKTLRSMYGNNCFNFETHSQAENDFLFLQLKNTYNIYIKYTEKINKIYDVIVQHRLNILNPMADICRKNQDKNKKLSSELDTIEEIIKDLKDTLDRGDPRPELYRSKLKKFCDEYTSGREMKSDAEIQESMSWLLFKDEFDKTATNRNNKSDTNKKSGPQDKVVQSPKKNNLPAPSLNKNASIPKGKKTNTKKTPVNSSPITNTNSKPLEKHEQILSQHSMLIPELLKELKIDFLSKIQAIESIDNSPNIKIHSKELRDHLRYASQGFNLFSKAILNHDLYAIGAIVPFLCMDIHLCMEQLIKFQIGLNGKIASSHNLIELIDQNGLYISPEQTSFLKDFRQAMIQTRYPVASKQLFQNEILPGPLQWMEYTQHLCQTINSFDTAQDQTINVDDLDNLCTFVVDSYLKTLQFVQQQLNPDLKINGPVSEMLPELKNLKEIFKQTIEKNKDRLLVKASNIKKSRGANVDSILKIQKNLIDTGLNLLNQFEGDKENPKMILHEASNHLSRIDAVDYLQKNYDDIQFAALHHRNLLSFQWVYEQLFRFNGYLTLGEELRWVCNHDLEAFHAYAFPNTPIPDALREFNFGRNLHYTREKGVVQSLSMIKELTDIRKLLKKVDHTNDGWELQTNKKAAKLEINNNKKRMKENRQKILKNGKELLGAIIKMTADGSQMM